MLSGQEKLGCVEILKMLSHHEVIGLCDTVTSKLIVPTNVEEAIEAIITYSKSAVELLNRKRLKHEMLFQYLHTKNVGGIVPKTTKAELVHKIIEYWRKKDTDVTRSQIVSRSTNLTQDSLRQRKPHQVSLCHDHQVPQHITINYNTVVHSEVKNITNVVRPSVGDGLDTGQQMAKEFILWFYPMLNNLRNNQSPSWGAQHFWPDAALALTVINESNIQRQEKFIGAEATQEKFALMVVKDKAVLNPNSTPEGYRGIISPHGLAKVAVCGTLHRLHDTNQSQIIVGVFEQCFGLIRDVNDGNRWKIKYSELKVKLMDSYGQTPSITLSEDTIKSICG